MDWDAAWDDHAAHLRLHQPHAAARGARDAGRCRSSARCCRATSRSSTRSTALPRRGPRALSRRRRRACARLSLIDESGERRVRMAHLATRRQPRRQRRRRAAHRAAQADRAARLRRALAGALPQRDQRRHAAALRRARNPGLARAASPSTIGDGWLTRPRPSSRGLEPLADDAAFREQWRADQARRTRSALAAHDQRAHRRRASTPTRCSTSR